MKERALSIHRFCLNSVCIHKNFKRTITAVKARTNTLDWFSTTKQL